MTNRSNNAGLQQLVAGAVQSLPTALRVQVPRRIGSVALRPTEAEERRQTVQDRLPVARLGDDGIVWLKPQYGTAVKMLEVIPLNFRLKSPFERKAILRSFTEALNSLTYPIQLRSHAEPLDLTQYVANLRHLAQESPTDRRRTALLEYASFVGDLTAGKELVRRRFFIVIPYVGTNTAPSEVSKALNNNCLDLTEVIGRCGLATVELTAEELTNVWHALLRPNLSIDQRITMADLEHDSFLNLVSPDCLEFTRDYHRVGDLYSRILMITNYPPTCEESWLSNLYSFSPNVAVVQYLEPTPGDDLQNQLSRQLSELNRKVKKGAGDPLSQVQTELKQQSGNYLLGQLASGSQAVLEYSMYVQITAESPQELQTLTRRTEALLGGKFCKTRRTANRTHQAFDTTLPVAANRLKEAAAWQWPAETVSSTFPFDHAELSHGSGILRGINKFTKNAVILDPYHPRLTNPHETTISTSGGGKTIDMMAVMHRSHAQGDRIFGLDIEREYGHVCKANGGQRIILAPGANYIINPMEIRPTAAADDENEAPTSENPKEDPRALYAGIQRQQTLFTLMLPDISETELAFAEEAQFQAYRGACIDERTDISTVPRDAWPHFGHLVPLLLQRPETERLGMVLKRWTAGSLQGVISGCTNVNLDSSFVIFDIHDLEQSARAQSPILYVALTYLWDEVRRDRNERKTVCLDELGLLAESKQALWFAWMMSKRSRKYSCRLKSATQQFADFIRGGHYAEAIVGNSETLVLGKQKETDLNALAKIIRFSEEELNLLATMSPKEKLLLVGGQRVLITVDCSPEEWRAFKGPKAGVAQ